tara:strand:+ start:113 stop:2113 length:2001 start_codon:yes stop_codon:yes gene_type:complete
MDAAAQVSLRQKLPGLGVEGLKRVLRRIGGRVSGRKAQLVERVVEIAISNSMHYSTVRQILSEHAAQPNAFRARSLGAGLQNSIFGRSFSSFLMELQARALASASRAATERAQVVSAAAATIRIPRAAHVDLGDAAHSASSLEHKFGQLCQHSDPFLAAVAPNLAIFFPTNVASLTSQFIVPPAVKRKMAAATLSVTFDLEEGGQKAAAAASASSSAAVTHTGTLSRTVLSSAQPGGPIVPSSGADPNRHYRLSVGRWSCCGAGALATAASCAGASSSSSSSSSTTTTTSAGASSAAAPAASMTYVSEGKAQIVVYALSTVTGRSSLVERQWPPGSRLFVNGSLVFTAPSVLPTSKTAKNNGVAVDITRYVRTGAMANEVKFLDNMPGTSGALRLRALLVRVVAPISVETMMQRIGNANMEVAAISKARSARLLFSPLSSKPESSASASSSSSSSSAAAAAAVPDPDAIEEMVATRMRLSLRCPLSLARLGVPARGAKCKHVSCFDLKTFLTFNKNKEGWKCPVCDLKVAPHSLVVDGYQAAILDETKEGKKRAANAAASDENDVIDAVILLAPDAVWEVAAASAMGSSRSRRRKRAAADAASLAKSLATAKRRCTLLQNGESAAAVHTAVSAVTAASVSTSAVAQGGGGGGGGGGTSVEDAIELF